MIEKAVNLFYQHSGDSQDRSYTEMFHVRIQNLKDSVYNTDTRRTATESALRYAVKYLGLTSSQLYVPHRTATVVVCEQSQLDTGCNTSPAVDLRVR